MDGEDNQEVHSNVLPDRNSPRAAVAFTEAVGIMARLRGPDGCPWDKEQNFDTIRRHTLEEAYEVLDAIERRDWSDLRDELGDLLLQVLFYSQMATEEGHFSITDVIEGLNRKLVRRHPHVFGDEASKAAGNAAEGRLETEGIDAGQVLRNWDAIKTAEKGSSGSRLGSVLRSVPALMESAKLGSRASNSGFDWPDVKGLFDKVEEEIAELHEAVAEAQMSTPAHSAAVEEELGDLLFTVANLARHLNVDPEIALRQANGKFRRRFQGMESEAQAPLEELTSVQLEELWARVKRSQNG